VPNSPRPSTSAPSSALPGREWIARHRNLTIIAALHVPVMLFFLIAKEPDALAAWGAVGVALAGVLAAIPRRFPRRVRAGATTTALLASTIGATALAHGYPLVFLHTCLIATAIGMYQSSGLTFYTLMTVWGVNVFYAVAAPEGVFLPGIPPLLGATIRSVVVALFAAMMRWQWRYAEGLKAAKDEGDALFKLLADAGHDVVSMMKQDGTLIYASPSAYLLGWDHEALRGVSLYDVIHPEDAPRVEQHYRDISGTQPGAPLIYRVATQATWEAGNDGTGMYRSVETLNSAEVFLDGKPVRMRSARDITARLETDQKLRDALNKSRRAQEVAERATRTVRELNGRMSHELRTPLHFIVSFAQVLVLQTRGQENEDLREILNAAGVLGRLIDRAVEVSASGQVLDPDELRPVPLEPIILRCLDDAAAAASERNVTLHAAVDSAAIALAEPGRLDQIISELLTNAIKFNQDCAAVVRATASGGIVRIEVIDSGTGINAEDADRAFEPFQRLGAEYGPVPGHGLGLSLVELSCEAMGGAAQLATSERGTTVTVTLPRARVPMPA
jgi:PAS domain S-box-containing protein